MILLDHNEVVRSAYALPPLPQSAARLAQLVANENTDLNDVVQVIEFDPVLTMKLLRMANSVLSSPGRCIGTVRDAVVRLGNGAVCGLAVGTSVKPMLGKKIAGYSFTGTIFWRHSLASAIAADVVKMASKERISALAFTAGLLHDIGKMVLGNFLNPEMLGWLESANRNGGAAAFRAESEILSLHHGEIGGIVAQHWQLPEPIVAGVIYHHAPEESDDPIAYAVYLANLIAHGWADDEVDENDPEQPSPTATIVAALERLGISEAVYQGFGPMVRARLKLALAGYD